MVRTISHIHFYPGIYYLHDALAIANHVHFTFAIIEYLVKLHYAPHLTFIMLLSPWLIASALGLLFKVSAFASTDSPSDADPAQSGYLPNHNMDPAVVDSASFGLLWNHSITKSL